MTLGYRSSPFRDVDWPSLVGLGALLGLAWLLVAFSTARALQAAPGYYSQAISIVIPTVFALTLFAGGIGIFIYGLIDQTARIAKWTGLGTASVIAAVVLNSLWVAPVRFEFDVALYTLVNAAIGGAVLGFLVGLYDAHQTHLKQELAAENQHSSELTQRLSVINRVLRHDMRHQTQLIQGHAERLVEDDTDATTAAARIVQANDRLLDLSEQARKLQELLSGERFGTERVDVVALAELACEKTAARHPSLSINCDLPPTQPICGSPLLTDVFKEVLDNAAVHNPADRGSVTLSLTTDGPTERPIVVTVADDGPGIPDTEPIRHGEVCESQLHHSNGFGLWFATWVVEETGGHIDIRTPETAGVGTEIEMRFPTPTEAPPT